MNKFTKDQTIEILAPVMSKVKYEVSSKVLVLELNCSDDVKFFEVGHELDISSWGENSATRKIVIASLNRENGTLVGVII